MAVRFASVTVGEIEQVIELRVNFIAVAELKREPHSNPFLFFPS